MRRAFLLAACSSALLLAVACASGGAAPAKSTRWVLVEVRGTGPEADAFASRLLYEAGEREIGVVDARLSGAHLADLSDPKSESSGKLREAFPGDAYVGADVGPCESFRRSGTMPGSIDPLTGTRTMDVVSSLDVSCSANVTELGADGKSLRTLTVEGHTTASNQVTAEGSSLDAAREAASQAARKLWGKRPR